MTDPADRRMLEALVCPVTHAMLTYDAEKQELIRVRSSAPSLCADATKFGLPRTVIPALLLASSPTARRPP